MLFAKFTKKKSKFVKKKSHESMKLGFFSKAKDYNILGRGGEKEKILIFEKKICIYI